MKISKGVVIPIPGNKFTFQLRQSCRDSTIVSGGSIKQYNPHLRSSNRGAFTRSNVNLFSGIGIIQQNRGRCLFCLAALAINISSSIRLCEISPSICTDPTLHMYGPFPKCTDPPSICTEARLRKAASNFAASCSGNSLGSLLSFLNFIYNVY